VKYQIKKTKQFDKWMNGLKDVRGKISIARRIERMRGGHFGDMKSVGDDVSELRITTGPGYRVYFTKYEDMIIVLLVGGDKSTQSKDIVKAKKLREELENGQ